MSAFIVVAGDFVQTGGMDAANYALAEYLARSGEETHLVAHRVAPPLASASGLHWHKVPRPFGSHLLGFPLLDRAGRSVASRLADRQVYGVVNGGNCRIAGATWLHYVHAAHRPVVAGRPVRRALALAAHRSALQREFDAVRRAPLLLANSRRTAQDAVELLKADPQRVCVAYYGTDPDHFRPPLASERSAARRAMGLQSAGPAAVFIGALGDRRKGFDTVMEAWRLLAADSTWRVNLLVLGAGSEAGEWQRRVNASGLGDRIRFLGFRRDVRTVLWACDVVVAPARYEAYGLAVQEALCCGLPAVVSADAGVAERITGSLRSLLLHDPEEPAALAGLLRAWQDDQPSLQTAALELASDLRSRTWGDMAREIVAALREGS